MAELSLSGEDRARVGEIERIAALGDGAVGVLIDKLTDPSWAVRRAVTGALARLGDAAVPALCAALLTGRDSETRLAAAVDTLVASRGDVDEPVLALLADPRPGVTCDAIQILGRRRSSRAIAALEALTNHDDDNVGLAAVEALGRIGGGAGLGALIALVSGERFFRTFPAIEVLGRSGDPRAAAPLIALLHSPLFAVEAARALGHLGDGKAAPALWALIGGNDPTATRSAAIALGLLAERDRQRPLLEAALAAARADREITAGHLARALAGAEPGERAAIAGLLGQLGTERAAEPLLELVSGAPAEAQAAIAALRRLGKAVEPALFAKLAQANSAARLALLPLVRAMPGEPGALARFLKDADPTVRVAACEAIARVGDLGAVAALFDALGDREATVAQAALAALQALGGAETEALAVATAGDPKSRVRRAAIRLISYFGTLGGLPTLLAALDDEDEKIRDAAIYGLPLLDDVRAVNALLRAAEHVSAKTRAAATRALGQVSGDSRVNSLLVRNLTDPDAWVRYYACQSLGKLRDRRAVRELIARLEDPAGQVRVAAVEALAHLDDERAHEILRVAASSSDPDVQRAALMGLGIGKRDAALPILIAAMASSESTTRQLALAAIAEYPAAQVIPILARATGDADDGVRSAALGFLAARPGVAASAALVELLDDPALGERAASALATPQGGRLDAVDAALETAGERAAQLLCDVLVRAVRPDATARLLVALTNDRVTVRRAAARALAASRLPEARLALERAAASDDDDDVRRICGLGAGG